MPAHAHFGEINAVCGGCVPLISDVAGAGISAGQWCAKRQPTVISCVSKF